MIQTFMQILQNNYYRNSVMLYVGIIASSTLFAYLSQRKLENVDLRRTSNQIIMKTIQKVFFVLSFLILWFFSAFSSCGADKTSYKIIFQNVSFQTIFDGWQEPGFNLFNLVFRVFGDNPRIIYVAMTTVTLLLVYSTLDMLKDEINVAFSVLAYGTLFYVQSLSLMRIYLASAILFWGIRFLKKNEYFKYGIVIAVAISIHYSCCIMLFPWIILYMMYHHRYKQVVHIVVIICMMGAGIVVLKGLAPIMGSVPMFARFQQYFQNMQSGGFGVMQFVYFMPIILLVLCVFPKLNDNYKRIFFTFTSSAFFVGVMSYVITILGRAFVLFSILYLFIVPYGLKYLKEEINRWKYYFVCVATIVYYVFRFMIYISEYYKLDQIIPYTNVLF